MSGVFIKRRLALALPLRAALVLRGAYAAADELAEGTEGEEQSAIRRYFMVSSPFCVWWVLVASYPQYRRKRGKSLQK